MSHFQFTLCFMLVAENLSLSLLLWSCTATLQSHHMDSFPGSKTKETPSWVSFVLVYIVCDNVSCLHVCMCTICALSAHKSEEESGTGEMARPSTGTSKPSLTMWVPWLEPRWSGMESEWKCAVSLCLLPKDQDVALSHCSRTKSATMSAHSVDHHDNRLTIHPILSAFFPKTCFGHEVSSQQWNRDSYIRF